VHRAEILRLRGAFAEAEEEARTATTELGSFNLDFAAMAFRELGEVRLRMGDLDAAEDAFRQANEMGVNPQPGLALALVQRGKTFAAANTLRRALADPGLGILERAKLLPTQVEVALLMDDVATAHEAVEELGTIAASYPSPALRATADAGAAAVRLADGALADAGDAARSAREAFEGIDLAYEAGKLSMLLGQIYLAQGDRDLARTETASALTTFERIGARPDADRARAALASLEGQAVE
jgi:tetratricopeptide (TPR) repeat protein